MSLAEIGYALGEKLFQVKEKYKNRDMAISDFSLEVGEDSKSSGRKFNPEDIAQRQKDQFTRNWADAYIAGKCGTWDKDDEGRE